MEIRPFSPADAAKTAAMVAATLRISNGADYSPEYIEEAIRTHSAPDLIRLSQEGHFYVARDGDRIVGCGGIVGYWGSLTESILLTVFVLPKLHGKGIGRTIMRTLEADAYYRRASRIEIPASIKATEFYRKFGYDFKNGIKELDEEGHYRLEKFREVKP